MFFEAPITALWWRRCCRPVCEPLTSSRASMSIHGAKRASVGYKGGTCLFGGNVLSGTSLVFSSKFKDHVTPSLGGTGGS